MTGWTFSNKYDEFYCWGVAIINFISEDTLELQFENNHNEPEKQVNRFSSTIAQLGTWSRQNDWKNGLTIGDQVDAFNGFKWLHSTILSFKELIGSNGRV